MVQMGRTHSLQCLEECGCLTAKDTAIVLAPHVHRFVLHGVLCPLNFFFSFEIVGFRNETKY